MSTTPLSPSARVAANRRRALLWLPLLVAGVFVAVAAGPMIGDFNSLDLLAWALMLGGVFGFVREVEK